MPRPRSALLSVELIVDAALKLVDETGDFSFPRIARVLGVSQSSLYNRISSREHIIELLRARIFVENPVGHPVDHPENEPWGEAARRLIRSYRSSLARHPNLVPLLVAQTVRAAEVMRLYEDLAVALERSGLAAEDIAPAISFIDYFALGSALEGTAPSEVWEVSPEQFPALTRAVEHCGPAPARIDSAFEFGLDALLAGIATRTTSRFY